MKVIVTGATGFVGRALVQALRGAKHDVIALVRDVDRARALLGVDLNYAQIADAAGVAVALLGSDAVINLAGEPIMGGPGQRFGVAHRAALESSRIGTTSALVGAIAALPAAQRPRLLVSASAIGFYGDRGEEELDETSTSGAGYLSELSQRWESSAVTAKPLGLRVVTPRIGVVLGLGGGALGRLLPIFRMGLGGPWGSGRQYLSWIHLHDLVAIFVAALTDEQLSGPINATAPHPVTVKEFARSLGQALHRPAFVPAPALALRAAFGAAADTLLHSQRVFPRAMTAVGFRFRFPELPGALADIVGAP